MSSTNFTLTHVLVPEILKTTKHLQNPLTNIFLGVSGGIDSVALFHAWNYIKEKQGIPFSVIHINHGLRGSESDKDEAFVKSLCEKNKVPFYGVLVDVHRENQNRKIGGLEEAARVLRYEAFEGVLKKENNPMLYLAHHQEDQVETVLMNLFRGSGLKGLEGIAPLRQWDHITIVRPFLGLAKDQLRQMLIELDQPWREDQSNFENIGQRNKLRNHILPLLYKQYPQMGSSIHRMTKVITAEEDYWAQVTVNWCEKQGYFSKTLSFIDYKAFIKEPLALQRRILRHSFEKALKAYEVIPNHGMYSLTYKQTDDCIDFLLEGKGKKFNLPRQLFAEKTGGRIYFLRENTLQDSPFVNLTAPFFHTCVAMGQWQFSFVGQSAEQMKCLPFYTDQKSYQLVDLQKYTQLTLRPRREGDFITPFGSKGKVGVKKLFINQKIDRALRDHIPLLVHGENEVLWIPNYVISKDIAVTERTNHGILIQYAYPYQI